MIVISPQKEIDHHGSIVVIFTVHVDSLEPELKIFTD